MKSKESSFREVLLIMSGYGSIELPTCFILHSSNVLSVHLRLFSREVELVNRASESW